MKVRTTTTIKGIVNGMPTTWPKGKEFSDEEKGGIPTDILLLLKEKSPDVEELLPSLESRVSTGISESQLKKLLEEIESEKKKVSEMNESFKALISKNGDLEAALEAKKNELLMMGKTLESLKSECLDKDKSIERLNGELRDTKQELVTVSEALKLADEARAAAEAGKEAGDAKNKKDTGKK